MGRTPRICSNARRRRAVVVFWDESGVSLLPVVRRTGAPVGHTPVIGHRCKWKRASMAPALCYGSRGGGAALAFHHQLDAYNTNTLIQALGELRRFLGGQKATLVWDGLPAHRSKAMGAWLRRQRSWLVVEPLPGYAPELNPVEALWSSLKGVELANLAGETLQEIIAAAERGIQRIRDTHHLAYSFLRHCGLSLCEHVPGTSEPLLGLYELEEIRDGQVWVDPRLEAGRPPWPRPTRIYGSSGRDRRPPRSPP
jgi:transposase